ncbi:MAG: hypothetical protein WCT53_06245 [Candidatus Gracilibacteria bacterium]
MNNSPFEKLKTIKDSLPQGGVKKDQQIAKPEQKDGQREPTFEQAIEGLKNFFGYVIRQVEKGEFKSVDKFLQMQAASVGTGLANIMLREKRLINPGEAPLSIARQKLCERDETFYSGKKEPLSKEQKVMMEILIDCATVIEDRIRIALFKKIFPEIKVVADDYI